MNLVLQVDDFAGRGAGNVTKSKEMKTGCNLAKSSKEGCVSKRDIFPTMMMMMMTTLKNQIHTFSCLDTEFQLLQ
jgi:hypothetical protein